MCLKTQTQGTEKLPQLLAIQPASLDGIGKLLQTVTAALGAKRHT
jgi:cation transporter-like permease